MEGPGDPCTKDDGVGDLKKLPNTTVKLITSSQVITSVFSVVKELVENSLDAKATSIDIKLDNCGFDRIEVRDNGTGIKSVDTKYMAQPHYTSKIRNTEDLEVLSTYGFRGEALGSLCSLANVSITTKTADDPVSMTYVLSHEGKVMDKKPSHLGQGTTVSVTNLFKNLPVRRQFYSSKKKQKDEMKRVEDVVISFAIMAYDVRFCLRHNNNIIWQKQPLADVKSVLISVFSVNVMMHMEQVKRRCLETELEIEAFLPKSSAPSDLVTRSTGDRLFCYINKRPVVMKDVEKLIRKLYLSSSGTDSTRYPFGFLHIVLPYKNVDVNLDPNKTRVLLQEKEKVFKFLKSFLDEIYDAKCKTATESCSEEATSSSRVPQSVTDDDQLQNNTDFSNPESSKISLIQDQHSREVSPLVGESSDKESSARTTDPDDDQNLEVDINFSDVHLTEELLKDFEDYEQSGFDVSVPELNISPVHTSTQAEESVVSSERASNSNQALGDVLNTDSDELVNTNSPDSEALKWALGKAVKTADRKVVEPVQVFKGGQTKINSPVLELEEQPAEGCTTPPGQTKTTKNRLLSSIKQSSLFDTSVKKPPSGYLYFSKEIRRKVLAENQGASFAEIAAIIVEKWKALSEEEKEKYEDLVSREAQWKKYEAQVKASKRQSDDSQITAASAKKCKLNKSIQQNDIQKLFESTSSKKKEQVKIIKNEKEVKFSITELKEVLLGELSQSQSQVSTKSLMLIGQLLSQSAWVCCHDSCLKLFQPIRAQEELIYRKLMANHKLATEPLDYPEPLTEDVLRPDLWKTLLSLKTSDIKPTDPYWYIVDARIVKNGFEIRHRIDPNTKQPEVKLIAMTTAVSGIDLKALLEILAVINRHYNVPLSQCRPAIIKHYLQSEAVRMSRQLPSHMSREDVQDLMTDLQCHLAGGTKTCFHGKPILHDLFDLAQLPDSQCSESDMGVDGL